MEDFIYARQSVDKEDSISIESQIELCLREVGNNPHRVFRDKGYSGKNTERPDFQDMMAAVRAGDELLCTALTESAVQFLTLQMLSVSCRSTALSSCLLQNDLTPQHLLAKQC